MRWLMHLALVAAVGLMFTTLGGCSAEEVGEDTDDLIEEVDFDEN